MMSDYLHQLEIELKLGRYNPKTVSAYLKFVKEFLEFTDTEPLPVNNFKIKQFIVHKYDLGLSRQTINLYLNAIKFFYKEILGMDQDIKIKLPKQLNLEPVLLSDVELKLIFTLTHNPKHRLICQISFGCGLRISEVLSLTIQDVDIESGYIRVTGRSKRLVMIPKILISVLQKSIQLPRKTNYLFESQMGGRLAQRGIQKVFSNVLKESGINKRATFQSFRHSFAVSLLSRGVEAKYVQQLLGLKNSNTMLVYKRLVTVNILHLTSPLDML